MTNRTFTIQSLSPDGLHDREVIAKLLPSRIRLAIHSQNRGFRAFDLAIQEARDLGCWLISAADVVEQEAQYKVERGREECHQ